MEGGGSRLALPKQFVEFLESNGIDPAVYAASDTTPRYIRLKPGSEDSLVEEIERELNCKLQKVNWLPGFYALPPEVHIASSGAYKNGKMYGIDAASGAAVSALNIAAEDQVLDLCAAPGAKLCMILDLLGDSGSVTAVDVARHRLAACRTLLQKYSLGNRCRLFVADGTSFSLPPLRNRPITQSCKPESEAKEDIFGEWTSRRSWKERQKMKKATENAACTLAGKNDQPELIFYGKDSGVVGLQKKEVYRVFYPDEHSRLGYDKVLVDAECTHDGSMKHVQKFDNWGWETLQQRVLNAERTDDLATLQLNLLQNGYRLLKVGGSLIYSTCSLTVSQNEDVVERFLMENASAELQPIDAAKDWPCKSGQISNTYRFDPLTSQTSGLFIAKVIKLAA